MEDDQIQFSAPDQQNHKQSDSHDKKSYNRPSKERRHSFKHAIVSNPAQRNDTDTSLRYSYPNVRYFNFLNVSSYRPETSDDSSASKPAASNPTMATNAKPQKLDTSKNQKGKKIHEYEAIWLSAAEQPFAIPSYDETLEKLKRNTQPANPDATLSQKTSEIQCLLSELRNASSEDLCQTTALPSTSSTSRLETPTSPRLHPDRVLSELQDLVERANRVKDENFKFDVTFASTPATPTTQEPSLVSQSPRSKASHATIDTPFHSSSSLQQYYSSSAGSKVTTSLPKSYSQNSINPLQCSASSVDSTSSSASSSSSKQANSSAAPPQANASRETKAPAFRPPPPYPAKFYVSLPSPATSDPVKKSSAGSNPSVQSSVQRRSPPEYKAPPPVKRTTQVKETSQPTAPPRTKRQTGSGSVQNALNFPNGPPVPTRTSSTGLAPGIDVDAVAAVMAAAESTKAAPSASGSSSPTAMANKALSKALGKFHATAASFKTKLAQLSDGRESEVTNSGSVDVLQRDANLARPYGKNLI